MIRRYTVDYYSPKPPWIAQQEENQANLEKEIAQYEWIWNKRQQLKNEESKNED